MYREEKKNPGGDVLLGGPEGRKGVLLGRLRK